MASIGMRACYWTFQKLPYKRERKPTKTDSKDPQSIGQLLFDALDLCFNLRGIGWSWADRLRVPTERRNLNLTSSFITSTALSYIIHFILFDLAHYAIQSFGPETIASPTGGSIFDPSLPPILRYARSSLIVLIQGFSVHCSMQSFYDLLTIISVIFFRHSPWQWPPISDKPWLSTSLIEFWNLRWHQTFRDCFINLGGKPFGLLLGRTGGIMGAFLVSGLLHNFISWGLGQGTDGPYLIGCFLMMGIGVILERGWKQVTGHRVGGILGWAWAFCWMIACSHLLVDSWARHGYFGSLYVSEHQRPSVLLFGSLFTN